MSRISNWLMDLEDQALYLTRGEFIDANGVNQAHVWDRIRGPEEETLTDTLVDIVRPVTLKNNVVPLKGESNE
jgi:hypothetical protein